MTMQTTRRNFFTLEITTSALCNLGCTYCFEGEKVNKQRLDDKLDVLKVRIYELLNSEWLKENYDGLNISFWGGEPTLNPDLIVNIMQEFQDRDDCDFHLYTNAYDRRRLDKILDNVNTSKLNVQISYDGKSINDMFRLTLTGKTTSAEVVENMEYFAKKGIAISLKSTIPLKSMSGLHKTWLDFKQLRDRFIQYPNILVTYSPTIDYVDEIPKENHPQLIENFRNEMLKIAKEEIVFFKENGYHLCSWFNGSDTKVHCSSGANMHAIDVDGNTYACHGSLYSPNKEAMKGGTITDPNFVDNVAKMSKLYSIPIRSVSDVCKDCVATTCMICPVASLDNSKKEEFFDRWTDRWVNNMCGFYKAFGEIDRTVQSYLEKEI